MNHRLVAGIDVGEPQKGFHAVALDGQTIINHKASIDASEVALWCKKLGVHAVGVDAPICWSPDGEARLAERELRKAGIKCFPTPSAEQAQRHPTGYYNDVSDREVRI